MDVSENINCLNILGAFRRAKSKAAKVYWKNKLGLKSRALARLEFFEGGKKQLMVDAGK